MKRTMKYRLRFVVCLFAAAVFFATVDTGSSQRAPARPKKRTAPPANRPPSTTSATALRNQLSSEKKKNEALELQVRKLEQELSDEIIKTNALRARMGLPPVTPPPVTPPPVTPPNPPTPPTPTTLAPDGSKVVIASGAAKLLGAKFASADRSIVLCSATGGKSVEMFLPCKPGGPLKTSKAGGKASIMYAGKDSLGRLRDLTLATVHITDGKLIWDEKKIPSSIRNAKVFGKIPQTLRLATLQVSDGVENLFTCQFVPVSKLDLKLTERSVTASLPYSYAICQPVMVLSADSNWTRKDGGSPGSESFNGPGGQSLNIQLKSDEAHPTEGMTFEATLAKSLSPATVRKKLVQTDRIAKNIFSDLLLKKKASKTYSPKTFEAIQIQTTEDMDTAIPAQISNLSSAISTCSKDRRTRGSNLSKAKSELSSAEIYLPKKYVRRTGSYSSTRTIDWAKEKSGSSTYKRYFKTYRECQIKVNKLEKDKKMIVFITSLEGDLEKFKTRLSELLNERKSLTGLTGASSVDVVIRAQESRALLASGKLTVGVEGGAP